MVKTNKFLKTGSVYIIDIQYIYINDVYLIRNTIVLLCGFSPDPSLSFFMGGKK